MSSIPIKSARRIRILFPFLMGMAVFLFIMWGIFRVVTYPDDGIRELSPTNIVLELDDRANPDHQLFEGDVILEINHVPVIQGENWYVGKKAGDAISYLVNRDGAVILVNSPLTSPSIGEVFRRILPLLVALVYWGIALWVGAYAPMESATVLFFWFFLSGSAVLASGQLSGFGQWIINLYYFLFWIIGPLSTHFHCSFPQEARVRYKKVILGMLYAVGFGGGLPYLIVGVNQLRVLGVTNLLFPISRIFLAINLLMVIWLLSSHYRYAENPSVKSKIRIVLLGGILAVVPFISLYILPEALVHKPIQPYFSAVFWLSVLPLTYGYAIFRYRIIEIEHHINRGVTVLLVFSVLVILYLSIYSLLKQLLPESFLYDPALNTFLILVLSTTIIPISRWVQRMVDTLFYGGWYDYRTAITQITSGLEQITDLRELASSIGDRLVRTLRIEDACIFLSDIDGNFSVVEFAPKDKAPMTNLTQFPILPRSSLELLLRMGGGERTSLAKALEGVKLSEEEHQLLNTEQAHLWVPVVSHSQIKGLLALGPKFGGDIFSSDDMDILRVVSRNLGPVIENIHLLNQLRKYAADLERRVQERTSELYDAKERVEAILGSVGDGVVVTDLNGAIEIVNKAMEKLSLYALEELRGVNIFEWLGEYNEANIIDTIKSKLAIGEVWSGELVHGKKNGDTYDVLLTIAPVKDQHGSIVNFVATQRDITYRKELDRLKDIFVADVSHELRTPTTNIGLYLELLESAPESKRGEYIKILQEQSQLLRRLVEDILDLSRLAIGKTKKIDFSEVDLRVLVEQAITASEAAANHAGIQLFFEAEKNLPKVCGDMNYLARVVNNLINNAVQYTLAGWVKVRLKPAGDYLCLEVEDTGIGISKEDMVHIFERFFRGQQVRQTRKPGTGLGLAIVREIVDLHGGEIEVESQENVGSKFRIYLPVWQS